MLCLKQLHLSGHKAAVCNVVQSLISVLVNKLNKMNSPWLCNTISLSKLKLTSLCDYNLCIRSEKNIQKSVLGADKQAQYIR